jgi:hypothetical protein
MTTSDAMAVVLHQRADNWELRCRFNHARIHACGLSAHLHVEYDDKKQASPILGLPPNTMTQMVYYFTDSGKTCEVARAHWVLLPTHQPDPKRLYINGVVYRQMKGEPKSNRDTDLLFDEGWPRESYKVVRRLLCRLLGPDADRAVSLLILKRMNWPSE